MVIIPAKLTLFTLFLLQIRDIRNEGRDLKAEFNACLEQTSKEGNRFSDCMLTNLEKLDGMFRTGEELAVRSSDAEVIRGYKQLQQELAEVAHDHSMEQNLPIRRKFLKKGN